MPSLAVNPKYYLKMGDVAVAIHCPSSAFADEACEHIFLSEDFDGTTIANIRYILDDTASNEVDHDRKENVVYINRKLMDDGRERIVLGMFNNFTAVLEVDSHDVSVRYPSHAPVRLLLDDVFQAALQPILDSMGGFILHGACMVRDDKAIVLMGNSGSGKSTTAFNLTRFGFSGYADDAVLVTPHNGKLTVWPLTRELSLRPLSFRLFQKQGIDLGDYKKYDDKYYFPQAPETLTGAALEHICFLEICGENESRLNRLSREQTHEILTENNRHFSFMGRNDANKYARILSRGVPAPLSAQLGTDLKFQGVMFDNLFSGNSTNTAPQIQPKNLVATRSQKSALIRQAWANPNKEPLQHLIPLLGDFDPTIFKLALGFFQTLPQASILPLEPPNFKSAQLLDIPEPLVKDPVPWFRGDEWLQGCKILVAQAGPEVFHRFVFSWIKSAPLLYPFLKTLIDPKGPESGPLDTAWERYVSERQSGPYEDQSQIHLLGLHQNAAWTTPDTDGWLEHQLSKDQPHAHLFCWVDEGAPSDWTAMVPALNLPPKTPVTVVPVLRAELCVENAVAFVRAARHNDIPAVLSRQVPLCRLSSDAAHWLFETGAFEMEGQKQGAKMRFFMKPEGTGTPHATPNAFGLAWAGASVELQPKPYNDCNQCRLAPLGLCRGGFFQRA